MAENIFDRYYDSKGATINVVNGIQDGTSLEGMTPQAIAQLQSAIAAAQAAGLQSVTIKAGKGGGHLSHSAGTEFDITANNPDGSRWSNAQRIAVANATKQAGADRFGLYQMDRGLGRDTLHFGNSGRGRPAGVWGANGLVRGPASRNFTDPAERAFLLGRPDSAVIQQIQSLGYPNAAAFQKAVGLPVDGVIGKNTLTALAKVSAIAPPAAIPRMQSDPTELGRQFSAQDIAARAMSARAAQDAGYFNQAISTPAIQSYTQDPENYSEYTNSPVATKSIRNADSIQRDHSAIPSSGESFGNKPSAGKSITLPRLDLSAAFSNPNPSYPDSIVKGSPSEARYVPDSPSAAYNNPSPAQPRMTSSELDDRVGSVINNGSSPSLSGALNAAVIAKNAPKNTKFFAPSSPSSMMGTMGRNAYVAPTLMPGDEGEDRATRARAADVLGAIRPITQIPVQRQIVISAPKLTIRKPEPIVTTQYHVPETIQPNNAKVINGMNNIGSGMTAVQSIQSGSAPANSVATANNAPDGYGVSWSNTGPGGSAIQTVTTPSGNTYSVRNIGGLTTTTYSPASSTPANSSRSINTAGGTGGLY